MAAIKADLDTLSELYRTLKTNVETTNTIQTQVDGSVNSAVWESTNATEFREQWTTKFKPALKALEDALAEAGTDVANNHNNNALVNGVTDAPSPPSPESRRILHLQQKGGLGTRLFPDHLFASRMPHTIQ